MVEGIRRLNPHPSQMSNLHLSLQQNSHQQLSLQPPLDFLPESEEFDYQKSRKLYLVPTSHGEVFDPDFAPNPSPLEELPNIERWTLLYLICVIEILAGRRPIAQIARSTHRFTFNEIAAKSGSLREVPRIKKIHRHQPIEGVVEVTMTLEIQQRVRALVARFEGVDKRWICTEFSLL
jgi:hypothetical protein